MKSSMRWKTKNALLSMFPIVLLMGCAGQQKTPAPLVEYRTITQPSLPIPAILTNPITVPTVPDNMKYGDSIMLNAELYGLLGQCNRDRLAVRKTETLR
ncbi:peptidase [Erwinia psidii]|nr:peptidase [Erwinia psidii]MCX8963242.1 peptidase [Erwinia psidii]MCX8967472.1 peptidase [Erwinia psidii]